MIDKVNGRTFADWLIANGAELLPPCQHEQARFRADGILCIVYERNRKGRVSCVPDLARDAFVAWQAAEPLDLSNPHDGPVEDWHAMGVALCAIATRAKAGETIGFNAEAKVLGIPIARLQRSMRAHGVYISEDTL